MTGTVFLFSTNQKFRMYYFWWILRHSHTYKLTNWLLIMFKGFRTVYFQSFMRLILIYKRVLDIQKGWWCVCGYCFKGIKNVFCHICIKILAKYFQYLLLRDEKMSILATRNSTNADDMSRCPSPSWLITSCRQHHCGAGYICCERLGDLMQPAVRSSLTLSHIKEKIMVVLMTGHH